MLEHADMPTPVACLCLPSCDLSLGVEILVLILTGCHYIEHLLADNTRFLTSV